MKLTTETLNVLKNFSTINQNLQFKKGNILTTVSQGKTVLAQANLKDDFPHDFCVYDLNEFLSVHSLYKDADIDFDDANIFFKNGRFKTVYRKTAKEMIVAPPDKKITLPSIDVSFTLTAEDYDWIMKTSAVLHSPNIKVESDGDNVQIVTFDAGNNSAHTNSIQVSEGNGLVYKIVFKTENIKMIPGSYDVTISFKGISHFKNSKQDIQYWIAFESKDSKIGE